MMGAKRAWPRIIAAVHPDRPADAVGALAVSAESLGYDGFWVADSQNLFRDVFVALTAVAAATEKVEIAAAVTNPVTRHPAVVAGAIGSVAELALGRTSLGIGTGETAVQTLGRKPARIAALAASIEAIRNLLEARDATVDEASTRLAWRPPKVRIVVAATAPRALGVAGKVGDVVYTKAGIRHEFLQYIRERVKDGARATRRTDEVGQYLLLPIAVGEPSEIRARTAGFVIALAVTTTDLIPREYWPADLAPALDRLKREAAAARERQGYVRWLQSPECLQLVSEDLVQAFAVAGERSEVDRTLTNLAAAGIAGIVVPMISPDPGAELHRLAQELPLATAAGVPIGKAECS